MNRRTAFLVKMVLSALLHSAVSAQSFPDEAVQQAILKGKTLVRQGVIAWDLERFMEARALFQRLLATKSHTPLVRYYLGYVDYRINLYYNQSDRKKALAFLNEAIDHLEQAIQLDNRFAEAFALLSSCYGQKIGFKPLLSMVLGPKSDRMMASARSLDPLNPRVILLESINTYFKPAIFGGSKKKALKGFYRAASAFERYRPKHPLFPDWGHAEVYAWIGLAHLERKEFQKARDAFRKALAIHPKYGWVRHKLLPKLQSLEATH